MSLPGRGAASTSGSVAQRNHAVASFMAEGDIPVISKGSDQIVPASKWIIVSYSVLSAQETAQCTPSEACEWRLLQRHRVTKPTLKGVDTHRTVSLMPMLRRAAHVVLMTGTPMANSCAQDVYPLLDALSGSSGAMPSLRQWNERYCLENRKVFTGFRYIDRWVGLSDEHGDELHGLLNRVMVRKRKEDVLHELPPKRRCRVVLQLKPSELKAVEKQMRRLEDRLSLRAKGRPRWEEMGGETARRAARCRRPT